MKSKVFGVWIVITLLTLNCEAGITLKFDNSMLGELPTYFKNESDAAIFGMIYNGDVEMIMKLTQRIAYYKQKRNENDFNDDEIANLDLSSQKIHSILAHYEYYDRQVSYFEWALEYAMDKAMTPKERVEHLEREIEQVYRQFQTEIDNADTPERMAQAVREREITLNYYHRLIEKIKRNGSVVYAGSVPIR